MGKEASEERRVRIDADLVRAMIAAQFPRWADLSVTPVVGGHDNRTFRLGVRMSVRLPSREVYAPQVEKENGWLPVLAPRLPLPIPVPLAIGAPCADYPWPWSVRPWLEGETAARGRIADMARFAATLADFLAALQRVDAAGGPAAGAQSFHRGASLAVYDRRTRETIAALGGRIDGARATAAWEAALASTWRRSPVWFHGDVSSGNLLVEKGRLSAVIDWGVMGVGDPACDLAIAWTLFDAESRAVFRAGLPLDEPTWARGRGWTLWKAVLVCAGISLGGGMSAEQSFSVIEAVLAEHAAGSR